MTDPASLNGPTIVGTNPAQRVERTGFLLGALAVASLQVALVLTHDPFVDEWQALQIAVQTPDLAALFDNLHYESHPPGWYIFLRGLSALVGPYHALKTASLLCGLFTLAILLFRSPFPRWMRIALALCPPLLFEFVAISRGHTLGLALFMGALALWHRPRLWWLPVALLPSIDFLYGVTSLCLLAWRWQDREGWWWPGVVGWLAVSLVSAWSIIPAADYVPVYPTTNGSLHDLVQGLVRMSIVYFPVQGPFGSFQWNQAPPLTFNLVCWLALFATILDLTARRRWDRTILFLVVGLMFCFAAWLYPLQNRHLWVLTLLMIAVMWRLYAAGETVGWIVRLWVVIGAAAGLYTAWFAFTLSFDQSDPMARFIRREGLGDEHWTAMPEMAGQGVAALTGIAFEKPGGDCLQQYVRWNSRFKYYTEEGLRAWLDGAIASRGRFYAISNRDLSGPQIRRLASFARQADGRQHYIYVFNPDAPAAQLDMPMCVSGLRPLAPRPAIGAAPVYPASAGVAPAG